MQVAEKKLQPATFPASFTGFSTNLLIKKINMVLFAWARRSRPARQGANSFGLKEEGLSNKIKGCDFGYALAGNSCEGAPGVDACTVTALDVITAFADS